MVAAMHMVHLLYRLGLRDLVPPLEAIEKMYVPPLDHKIVRAQYDHSVRSATLMTGDLSMLTRDSLPWACYGPGYDEVKASLADRLRESTILLGHVIARAVNGGHYDVDKYVGDTSDERILLVAMNNVFTRRNWGEALWETEQDAIKAVEFFRSLGVGYQLIAECAFCQPILRDYLTTKDINWYELVVSQHTNAIVDMLKLGLVKWEKIKYSVTGVWYSDNNKEYLVKYLLDKGLETRRSLIYAVITDSANICQRGYIESAAKAAKEMSDDEVTAVIQLAVQSEYMVTMKVFVCEGMVTWRQILEMATAARVSEVTMVKIRKYVASLPKVKRMKVGAE